MTYNSKSFFSRCMPAIGSLAVVTGLGLLFMGFVQQFIDYALNMLSQASGATMHHLHIIPLH